MLQVCYGLKDKGIWVRSQMRELFCSPKRPERLAYHNPPSSASTPLRLYSVARDNLTYLIILFDVEVLLESRPRRHLNVRCHLPRDDSQPSLPKPG